MKGIKRGGVHPPEMKLTSGMKIIDFPLPRHVEISLSQSLGRPASPIVKAGDHVTRFDKIGEAQGPISANVHTPITGTVKSVGKIMTADGHGATGVVIDADEADHAADLQSICDARPAININNYFFSPKPEEIIETIREAGIVGMGGATFPTTTKLTVPEGKKCKYLLINGAECEPYLTCDEAIMREMAEEIVTGIEIMLSALDGFVLCIIGIEENKPEAIEAMDKIARRNQRITVVPMRTKYPQGGEKMLTKTLTGREIAPGALPISEGVIIQNVATALAVYYAVVWRMPLVERVMTLSGGSYAGRCNVRVPIGTPLSDIIDKYGGIPDDTVQIVNGGTMMGRAMAGIQGSTTKGMSGLLMLSAKETNCYPPTPCVRCGKCAEACPMGLQPFLLARLSELGRIEEASRNHIMDCMECGCCSFSCMAHRHIVDWIKVGKAKARALR